MKINLLNTFQMLKSSIFVDRRDGTIPIGKPDDLVCPRTEEVCRNRFDRVVKEVKEPQGGKVFEQFRWIWEGFFRDLVITNKAHDY